jgi:hypothetical protein
MPIFSRKIWRKKTDGYLARSSRALSRVLSLKLKGHVDCRMCPEWDRDLLLPTESVGCSQAPKTESFEYWNMKGQPAAVESPAWRLVARSQLSCLMAYK